MNISQLHAPVSAPVDSAEDWRRCGTCGCPEYDVVNDEHPTGQRYTVAGAVAALGLDDVAELWGDGGQRRTDRRTARSTRPVGYLVAPLTLPF